MSAQQRLYNYAIYLLGRKDYSSSELRQKMALKIKQWGLVTEEQTVNHILEKLLQQKWLKSDQQIAELYVEQLHRRNKGQKYIQNKLSQRRLPPVQTDADTEVEKALQVLQARWSRESSKAAQQAAKNPKAAPHFILKTRLSRLLISRGFSGEVVRKSIEIILKDPPT
ncbi:MAG: regulatory protein RecX [Pseudobdellovibrionaceae bacterium]